jgi:hypothetical protein
MQPVAVSLLFGLVCAGMGLAAEWHHIPGLCYATGYHHLRAFDSLFYAVGNPKSVMIIAFILNVAIGALISLPFTILIEGIERGRTRSQD